MNSIKYMLIAMIIGFSSNTALAHHAFSSHFDPSKSYQMEGVLTRFDMRNPHSFFFLDVKGENGETENWEIELSSAVHLRRMGIDRKTFSVGDKLKVSAWPNRTPGKKFVYGMKFEDTQGNKFGDYPKDKVKFAASSEKGVDAVFGRWFSPLPHEQNLPPLPLNKAGLLAEQNYIAQLSPANICEPASIPDLQLSPYITDIRLKDDTVIFTHEAYGIIRTIPVDSAQSPVDETGWMGIASARIDGNQLIVESRNYPVSRWGLGGAAQPKGGKPVDYPSSSLKTVTERYFTSEDGQVLSLAFTLDDPAYLTEPYSATMTATRVADTQTMFPFMCEPDAASRFSD